MLRFTKDTMSGRAAVMFALLLPATGAWADDPATVSLSAFQSSIGTSPIGPVPAIVVDQFGYQTDATKIAVIREPRIGYDNVASYEPGARFAVVDAKTGEVMFAQAPELWGDGSIDTASGDRVWWFDFSRLNKPGSYAVVDLEQKIRSYNFAISENPYRKTLAAAVKVFFYQRAGFEKTAATAGAAWADRASHMGPGQDGESHSWTARTDESLVRDLRGGWYDAGDYNKYTSWAARNVSTLLSAYQEAPSAFGDDTGIAESGNGVPDILDEARWGLQWLVRMQNADGSMLCIQSLAAGSPPSAATGPSYYGPPTTAATLMGAAAFAHASRVFGERAEPELKAFAAELKQRAQKAWDWAETHPNVAYYNNDESKQPGSGGLGAGQQEMAPAQRDFAAVLAAIHLYSITGDRVFKALVTAKLQSVVPDYGPTQWDVEQQDAVLYFVGLPGIEPEVRSTVETRFKSAMTSHFDQLPMVAEHKDPYRAALKDYVWGSNSSKAAESRLYYLLSKVATDGNVAAQAKSAASDYLHYLHGVNPLGLVYLSNMSGAGATHSVSAVYHLWFNQGSPKWGRTTDQAPGPPPGYLVGGPNPLFSIDNCCSVHRLLHSTCGSWAASDICSRGYSPPMGQPAMKSYLDFNSDWPGNSWQIAEPSTLYQSNYILALAPFAR